MTQTATELCYLTIREAGALLRDGRLSPVELTRAFLERIESLDGTLQAYITVLADDAMASGMDLVGEESFLRSAAVRTDSGSARFPPSASDPRA